MRTPSFTLLSAAALLAAGCATSPPETPAAAPRPPAAVAPVPPGSPPPFAALVKDARRIDGPLVLWQKDEKVWIELSPQQFGQPFLLSPKIRTGIGEGALIGGLMASPVAGAGGPQVVEFVRVHQQVRLQSRNVDVTAAPGTPEARALAASYANSLLGSTTVASQPHPESQAVLIDAGSLFLTDMLGVGMLLQRTYRQGYGLDTRHTGITAVRGSASATVIETQNHYYTANLGVPLPGQPLAPQLPRYLPDARSMLVGLHFSLAALPAVPMAARRADPRVGLFTSTVLDFGDDLSRTPRQRHIHRWRLEKKDPAAPLSEPVKPIAFVIDRNVPLAYRATVKSAILEWNKAFERIGFRNAITATQQADDADYDTLDVGIPSVRWMMSAEPMFSAIGPSHVDPRSGEILDADIGFEGATTRLRRIERAQVLAGVARGDGVPDLFATPFTLPPGLPGHAVCSFGDFAAEQLGYALDVLAARDELETDSPQAQAFVLDFVKDTVMHEVGHALGLRHNFRASRAYTEEQLADAEFTRDNGTTGSVMEYNAINLPRPGERGGVPFQLTLGPYDYWAIEYAYKPIAPADEAAELRQIAARGSEPLLAFGTDEDALFGLDPETLQFDLGADPIAFAAKRLDIARDLFRRQETRELAPERDYAVLRRSLGFALADVQRAVAVLARQLGGVRTLRDFPGSGRDPLQPVDAATQRRALDLMVQAVFGADGLSLSPALQRRLAPDYLDRGEFGVPTDYALPQRLLDLQRGLLGYLMSETLAARVLDGAAKFDHPADAYPLAEVYARLNAALWTDLDTVHNVTPPRRELQREHVNRLANSLLRPPARADARALLRQQAQALLQRLDKARQRPAGRDDATHAHLADSADTLRQALASRLPRQAV